jgi:hypothetical protein
MIEEGGLLLREDKERLEASLSQASPADSQRFANGNPELL